MKTPAPGIYSVGRSYKVSGNFIDVLFKSLLIKHLIIKISMNKPEAAVL